MLKILIIGPFPPPITGQSLSNRVVYDNFKKRECIHIKRIDLSHKIFDNAIGKLSTKKLLYSVSSFNLLKLIKTDVIYATPGWTFLGILKYMPFFIFAYLLKKKIILHIHNDSMWIEYSKLNGIKKMIYQKILSLANCGIVLSESLKRNLSPFVHDKNKIFVVSNFVEAPLFDFNIKSKLNNGFNSLKICYLSNLMEQKGIYDFFKALILLKKNGIHFSAHIAGEIDLKIKNDIDEYLKILKENIIYYGSVSLDEKKDILINTNVFVFPSKFNEGQPIVLLEALATANIILTTPNGGIKEIISENKNGFFINPADFYNIYEKLIYVNCHISELKVIALYNHYYAKKFHISKFLDNIHTSILKCLN